MVAATMFWWLTACLWAHSVAVPLLLPGSMATRGPTTHSNPMTRCPLTSRLIRPITTRSTTYRAIRAVWIGSTTTVRAATIFRGVQRRAVAICTRLRADSRRRNGSTSSTASVQCARTFGFIGHKIKPTLFLATNEEDSCGLQPFTEYCKEFNAHG